MAAAGMSARPATRPPAEPEALRRVRERCGTGRGSRGIMGCGCRCSDGAVCSGRAGLRGRIYHQTADPKVSRLPGAGRFARSRARVCGPARRAVPLTWALSPTPRRRLPSRPRIFPTPHSPLFFPFSFQGRIEYLVKWKGWAIK